MSEWRGDEPPQQPPFPPPPPGYPYPGAAPQHAPGHPYDLGPVGPPKNDSGAVTALVLGILGFFCCLFGFAAIYEGHEARQRIVGAPEELKGEGMALAGMTLGIISLVLSIVGTIVWIAV